MRLSTQRQGRSRSRLATATTPAVLLCVSALLQATFANPYPKDDLHDTLGYGFLQDRSCAAYCGVENEHCCSPHELCTTSNSIAGCAALATLAPRAADPGTWSVYTTTWTETDTFTSTISSYLAEPTGAGGGAGTTCVPSSGSGEIACGAICCASWQYCAYAGQCSSNPGATAPAPTGATSFTTYATTMTTAGRTITTQFSAPYRVTGTGSTSTNTNTATVESATTTSSGNGTAVSTTGGSTLSPGAIAGIVVGVLVGVGLLLLLCFCCIMRGLWHGLLALLGLGPRKRRTRSRERETVIVEEERYARRGSNHARRDTHGSWFAARPARSTAAESRRTSEKPTRRESNQASWWGAGALGTLLLLLGLRRDKKRRSQTTAAAKRNSRRPARSEVSSSYFSDSYTASSPSEFSSDYTYSSVYTPAPAPARSSSHAQPRGPRTASVVRSQSVRSASRYREDPRDYDLPPKSNVPPDYAGSASSGGRTRDTRRSRRTETTRISRAPSRR